MNALPVPPDERRTLELVERARGGEDGAWQELYDRYRDELLFAVRARLGDRLRARVQSEDVLQSVALEVFRELPRFEDRGRGSLRGFLHRLVGRKVQDLGRFHGAARRAGTVGLDGVAEPAAGPETYRDERYARLEEALGRLPGELREIVVLRAIEGVPSKEVAARTGRTDAAVRKLHSRAMARLAVLMGDGEPT